MQVDKIKKRINEENLNSFIVLDPDCEGGDGKLTGKTLSVKSAICVDGLLTAAASETLKDYIAPYDAHVIERVKVEGGAILGMANMDEFACGASGETSYYGPTQNPAAPGRIPGGSSSGSAASVAAGYVDLSLGTDTGGSIRNPCSHCGVVGFKSTYGVVSRYGVLDMAMSLEQVGPVARSVKDAALLLEVIAGHDPRDATSLNLDKDFYDFSDLDTELSGKRIGFAKEFEEMTTDPGIKELIRSSLNRLADAGAEIIDVKLPSLDKAIATYYLNVFVEFFSATRKYDGRRYGKKIDEVGGEEVQRRILLGSYISQKEFQGKFYRKALQARSVIRNELLAALKDVDVLAAPTVPRLPHKLGESISTEEMYAYDAFTVPVNLAGVPAGSVPAGKVEGIPTGLQIIGKPLEDKKVLDVMAGFEKI